VKAEHLDGSTAKAERDAILARLAAGETEVVCNCMVLTEGWDPPALGCIVLARPTKQIGLFRQMAGRGLRPAPGKSSLILIDHSGAVFRHGLLEDPVDWTLDTTKRAHNHAHDARSSHKESRLCDCSQCGALRKGGEACASCGFLPKRKPDLIVFREGELTRVDRDGRAVPSSDPNERMCWHAMLAFIAAQRGYKSGWVAHKFKEKFGTWPAARSIVPIEPSAEVLSWVRSRAIAWAKAQEKLRGNNQPQEQRL
jgi:DNA repair protein RadD